MTDRPEDAATAEIIADAVVEYSGWPRQAAAGAAAAVLVALSEQGYSVKKLEQAGWLGARKTRAGTLETVHIAGAPRDNDVPVFREV